ncbi:MAG: V-type ATPase subunit [Candidatus Aminicenantes bacterium]
MKVSRLDYTFAVGRIRALENRLIPREVFLESAEEKDFSSALKVLFDAGTFLEEMEEIKDTRKLDVFLNKEYQSLLHSTSDLFLEKEVMKVLEEEYSPEKALIKAKETGYSFIINYVRHQIDLGNLKMLARVKYLELAQEKLNSILMAGGFIQRDKIKGFYDLSYSDINEALKYSPYFEEWSEGMDALQEEESFVEMEKKFENFLMTYLRKARYVVFGPEPVFTYVLSKKRELSLFRMVGVGKINHIPKDLLKNRISETYV